VRRGFASYGRYWVEAFRLEDLTPAEIRGRLRIEGREHIDTALAAGRGAIFASPHIGNWDAGGAWLAASRLPGHGGGGAAAPGRAVRALRRLPPRPRPGAAAP
jgi:lauroyl/myristoyl acyltransferase